MTRLKTLTLTYGLSNKLRRLEELFLITSLMVGAISKKVCVLRCVCVQGDSRKEDRLWVSLCKIHLTLRVLHTPLPHTHTHTSSPNVTLSF